MKEHLLEFFENIPDNDDILIKGYENDAPRHITRRELRKKVSAAAGFLKDRGIAPGEHIAVISEKSPDTIAAFFGIWLNNAVCVPICETLTQRDLTYIAANSKAKMALCSENIKKSLEEALSGLGIPVYDFSSWKKPEYGGIGLSGFHPDKNPENTAFLLYTSGSTGNAKGVMLTHRNIALNAQVGAEYIKMTSTDAILSALPYWHSFALTAEIFTMLYAGGEICIPKNRATLLDDMRLFRPSIVLSVPRIAEMIKKGIENALSKNIPLQKIKEGFGGRLKYFIGGGAPLETSLQVFFLNIGIPMYQGYGLTEAAPIISINAPHSFRIGTSGCIIPWLTQEYGGDYTFLDENGNTGKHLKGELLVRGNCVMKGYWRMEEETRNALKDGWLYTGDMGYIDKEGYLVLFGRKKNLLCLKGGEKFYPEFVEERLKTSPYISQAMVIGEGCRRPAVLINYNKDLLGQCPKEKIEAVISGEIRELTKDLDLYQRPARHAVLPEFTIQDGLLTNTLKIKRHEVLDRFKEDVRELLGALR
ncbi:MAG: AMP-binding protein [Candidatus Omnitrophota bacterium]